jgi:NADPH-dependent 2,4-dienoyl-CoA reductase/sulfur reductase-like enzyme
MARTYPYLIVGGGMAAAAAAKALREVDPDGAVAILSAEQHPPYDRPPLSKGLWKGKPFEKIWRKTEQLPGVELILGRRAVHLDPKVKKVWDDHEEEYQYGRLLLATGGTPRRLPFGGEAVLYYRTVEDYRRLRQWSERGQRFAVIGGGFIGSEIAAALRMNGKDVSFHFPGPGIGGRVFPADLATFLNGYYREKGVDVFPEERVVGVEARSGRTAVRVQRTRDETERIVEVDGVVAGIGIEPSVDLARQAELKVTDGIEVDVNLRTSDPSVLAAGDVATFFSPVLEKRLRVEHEDNANTMGAAAGRALAGSLDPYLHLPFFYSDLFELGYEAVGDLDSTLETVADWHEPYRKGVVYYLAGGRVRGVLLWNVWDQVNHARRLIAEAGPFAREDLKGRLPA